MKNWMHELAEHYEKMRNKYPHDKLIILFDIDGTIVDMRHMMFYVLKNYDLHNKSSFFSSLKIEDIDIHENHPEQLFFKLDIPYQQWESIKAWYLERRWSKEAIISSHRPFKGVLEIIRWFQMQPNTYVGLNTGRPESIRRETLISLNRLGKEYKVKFTNELLYMNPVGWKEDVSNIKAKGIDYFRGLGYRPFAMIDNEPKNLEAVSRIKTNGDILLLHAETTFESESSKVPPTAARGRSYDITELANEKNLPRHIQFVWHGVNDRVNLEQFISSNIRWGEMDIRRSTDRGDLILRHDSFEETPLEGKEELLPLYECLVEMKHAGKGAKLDLKEGGQTIEEVLDIVSILGFEENSLWFNGGIDTIGEKGFRKIVRAYPNSIIQCPIDWLSPMILGVPSKARDILKMLHGWGINRLSLNWRIMRSKDVFDRLNRWGYQVNIYGVPNLEEFLRAVLLSPRSITSDFNFPKWNYHGNGSGERVSYPPLYGTRWYKFERTMH